MHLIIEYKMYKDKDLSPNGVESVQQIDNHYERKPNRKNSTCTSYIELFCTGVIRRSAFVRAHFQKYPQRFRDLSSVDGVVVVVIARYRFL